MSSTAFPLLPLLRGRGQRLESIATTLVGMALELEGVGADEEEVVAHGATLE
jgi:hypothetical protein